MFKLTNNNLSSKTINQYRTDRAYGCYTRNCLELEIWPAVAASVRYVVFADLDQMHKAKDYAENLIETAKYTKPMSATATPA